MILRRIQIDDFQSIDHAVLYPGQWTSLVGESDVGKSAVIRAIHAALTNRTGDTFIRAGAPSCVVSLATMAGPDGIGPTIVWEKRRGRSGAYAVQHPDGRVDTYEKTGGVVPREVEALLRVSIDVAGEPLLAGIQRQHDAPFLLADSPRRRAQVLGEFDGTNITLRTEGFLRTVQRAAQAEVKAQQAVADAAAARLLQYEPLHAAEEAYTAAERALAAHAATEARLRAMQDVAARWVARRDAVLAARSAAQRARHSVTDDDLHALALGAARVGRMRQTLRRWSAALASASAAAATAAACRVDVSQGDVLDVDARLMIVGALRGYIARMGREAERAARAAALLDALTPVAPAAEAFEQQGRRYKEVSRARMVWRTAATQAARSDAAAAAARAAYDEAVAALAALAGQPCPVCGQPLAV